MSYTIESSRWIARLRAPLLAAAVIAVAACDNADSLSPESSALPPAEPAAEAGPEATPLDAPEFATAFAGGIPIGTSNQPLSQYGSRYNGSLQVIWPGLLRAELATIKARGGKVVLSMAGNEKYYKDGSGHFSMTKWKQRIDRYKGVNFDAYIKDGTIIGHYLLDEPNDPSNWNGQRVSGRTVDEMARYSKQLWPGMPTIVRTEPGYFDFNPRYLDAAWAQYLSRRGNVSDYIRQQVAAADRRGLALVVGMNVLKGGKPNGTRMSATEVKSWGATLLSSSYPCAFVSWKYNSDYLNTSSMRSAMSYLRNKAESHRTKSCRGS